MEYAGRWVLLCRFRRFDAKSVPKPLFKSASSYQKRSNTFFVGRLGTVGVGDQQADFKAKCRYQCNGSASPFQKIQRPVSVYGEVLIAQGSMPAPSCRSHTT